MLGQFARDKRGATAIEFALIGMVLISVTVGTIEVGRALMLYNALAHGADRAARLLMVYPTETDSQLVSRWQAEQAQFPVGIPSAVVPQFGTVSGIYRPVSLSYQFQPMVPGIAFTAAGITISATRRVPMS